MFTEPKCDWYDGCSLYERGLIEEEERRKYEELKALIKQIRMERAVEDAKIAVVEEVCIIFNVFIFITCYYLPMACTNDRIDTTFV